MAAYPIASGQDKKKSLGGRSKTWVEDSASEEHKSCNPAVVLKSDTFYGYGHARKKNQIVSEQVDPILLDPDSASFSGSTFLSSALSANSIGEEES